MNIKKISIVIFLLFGIISTSAHSAETNNFAVALIADDFAVFTNASESGFSENELFKMLAIDLKINATDYDKTFDQNEVLANQKFKNKTILFSGKIKSIDIDMMGNPNITFVAGNNYSGVIAKFSKSQTDLLAKLQKGKSLSIVCKGDGKLMQPSLKECKFPFQYALENKNLEKFLNDALKGKIGLTKQTGESLASVFVMSEITKRFSTCSANSNEQGLNKKCESETAEFIKSKEMKSEMKIRFDEYYKTLKILN